MQFLFACIVFSYVVNTAEAIPTQSALSYFLPDPLEEAHGREIIKNVSEEVAEDVTEGITDVVAGNVSSKAQEDLAASENALEKLAMRHACEIACDDIETCGFLVNGPLIMDLINGPAVILFAFLIILKC